MGEGFWLVVILCGYFLAMLAFHGLGALFLWWIGRKSRADNFFHRGEAALDAGEFTEAIRLCDKALKIQPNEPDIYSVRALAWSGLNQPERAMEDLDRALTLKPDSFYAYNCRGNVHANLGNIDAAFEDFRQSIGLYPDEASTYFERACLHFELGNLDSAQNDLKESIEIDPEFAVSYRELGKVLIEKGEIKPAIKYLTRAIRLDEELAVDAYFHRGLAWNAIYEHQKAFEDFSRSLEIEPGQLDVLIQKAWSALSSGEFARSTQDFSAILRLDPKSAAAWYGRGYLHFLYGNYSAALADLDVVEELTPDDSTILVLKGLSLLELKESDKARGCLEGSLLKPSTDLIDKNSHLRRMYYRSVALSYLQQHQTSLEVADEIVAFDSRSAYGYDWRSWIRSTCPDSSFRNGELAVEDGVTACELVKWSCSHRMTTLAAAYAEAGDFVQALEWIDMAIQKDDCFSDRRKRMRELFQQQEPYRHPVIV